MTAIRHQYCESCIRCGASLVFILPTALLWKPAPFSTVARCCGSVPPKTLLPEAQCFQLHQIMTGRPFHVAMLPDCFQVRNRICNRSLAEQWCALPGCNMSPPVSHAYVGKAKEEVAIMRASGSCTRVVCLEFERTIPQVQSRFIRWRTFDRSAARIFPCDFLSDEIRVVESQSTIFI